MNIQKKKPVYIEQLTWLRGIAAFFVIVSHSMRATEVQYTATDTISHFYIMSFFDLGSFGVVLFFVLSGCTLYISNSGKVAYKGIYNFYIKRFFRIWPAFVVSLILYMGFAFIFSATYIEPQGHWIEKQFLQAYTLNDVFAYLTFSFNITGPDGLFNNAYWSLPIEFQYYILFPVIIASLRFGLLGPLVLSILLYLLPKLGLFDVESTTVFGLAFSFCGGVLIGYLYEKFTFRLNPVVGLIALLIIMYLASAISHSSITLPDLPIISGKWNWFGGMAIISVFIVLIVKINIHNNIECFLKHYGTISYSTYLYHNLFIGIITLLIIHFEIHDGGLRLFITFFFTLLFSYLAAILSYRFIEKPSITLGRKIVQK